MYIMDGNDFWPGLGLPRPKALVVIPKNQPLPKYLRKKRVKVRSTTGLYATKKRAVKITMYLGLDIITGWERTVHVSRCPALYSGRIFVSLCRELIIFVF